MVHFGVDVAGRQRIDADAYDAPVMRMISLLTSNKSGMANSSKGGARP
jgi:hypothetical protein